MGTIGLLDPTAEPDEIQSRVHSVSTYHEKNACGFECQVLSTPHHMYCIRRHLHTAYFRGRQPPQEYVNIVQDGSL